MEMIVTLHLFQVFPFTSCNSVTEQQQYRESKLTPKKFMEKSCTQTRKTIPHKKLLPDCKNITKQNCVLTNWETDQHGNQVNDFQTRISSKIFPTMNQSCYYHCTVVSEIV